MPTLTVDVSDDLERWMRDTDFDIDRFVNKQLRRAVLEDIASRSSMTMEDALELGRAIKESMTEDLLV